METVVPELPEVETVKRGLAKLIVGKTIKTSSFDWPKSFPNDPSLVSEFMIGAEVTAVRRRAKVLLIDLSTDYTLMTHLKMTGQLVFVAKSTKKAPNTKQQITNKSEAINTKNLNGEDFGFRASNLEFSESSEIRFGAGHPNDSLVSKLPDKSTRVDIVFEDESHLYFNDQRKFGWMKLLPTSLVDEEPFMQKVGPEPLEKEFTDKIFISRVRRRANTSIKAAILDQTVLAGVGNIYADESLWGAKIHPATLVKNVSEAKLKKLHSEIVYVLNLSIEKGGSTDRNYVNAEGKKGSYIEFARVFRKENQPCPRCQTTIIKIRVATRGTHLCPKCQILTK
jgi:formamidopyrimidine-DNA glycosylase